MIQLNSPDHLPPVDCPLVVELPNGELVRVERTSHLVSRERDMEYRLDSGETFMGRMRWGYP